MEQAHLWDDICSQLLDVGCTNPSRDVAAVLVDV